MFRIPCAVFAGLSLLIGAGAASAQSVAGRWDAAVLANGVAVPFRFEITTAGADATGSFFDGSAKIASTSGRVDNNRLIFEYDFLNTVLDAVYDGQQLRGTYRNRRPGAVPMEFVASRYVAHPASPGRVPQAGGDWVMYRTAQDNNKLDVSWRLHLTQSGSDVSGAILKTSGDTGTLTGEWRDGRLTLSHFAGNRPLLLEARVADDGTLSITLDRKYTYRAARQTQLAGKGIPSPPDLSQFTSMKDPRDPLHWSAVDPDGKAVSDADARFRGKVVVLTIGGTWCANCHDEAPFLSSLSNEFHAGGLEVVGLFFENDADLAVVRPRILAFAKRYGVTYPIVFAGTTDQAEARLSQLRNFSVYPTTIIIGRDGRVRSVHAGFASTATGAEHERLTRDERALVGRLLAEKAAR
jgi:thiol-disulfide isomerase/thioredoxin